MTEREQESKRERRVNKNSEERDRRVRVERGGKVTAAEEHKE